LNHTVVCGKVHVQRVWWGSQQCSKLLFTQN